MTVALVDGILGLEGIHTWTAASGEVFALNDMTSPNHVSLEKIAGIHSTAEADDNRSFRTAMPGEIVYPSYRRGKTIVYEGRIRAGSLQALRAKCNEMRRAFRERSVEGTMWVAPHASYGSGSWGYNARAMQLEIDTTFTSPQNHPWGPFQHSFTLGLRMSDARYYWSIVATAGDIASGTTVVVNNQGTTATDPIFTISVLSSPKTVTVENLTTGKSIVLTALPVSLVTVNFKTRTIRNNNGADFSGYFSPASTWWDELVPGLVPGNNSVRVRDTDGLWLYSFQHASE